MNNQTTEMGWTLLTIIGTAAALTIIFCAILASVIHYLNYLDAKKAKKEAEERKLRHKEFEYDY